MSKKRFAFIAIASGIATEIVMQFLNLGVPYLNGCIATVTVTIMFFNKSYFSKTESN